MPDLCEPVAETEEDLYLFDYEPDRSLEVYDAEPSPIWYSHG